EPTTGESPAPTRQARRRALLALGVIAVLFVGGAGTIWHIATSTRAGSEAERFKHAQELYGKEEFADANEALQKLIKDFPDSREIPKYRLLGELSSVRRKVYEGHSVGELQDALGPVLQFIGMNQQAPILKEYHADVWKTLYLLAERLAGQADTQ